MRRMPVTLGILLLISIFATAGCYTVLRHPTGSEIVSGEPYYRSCADCHADAEYYHPYSSYGYGYGYSNSSWRSYYGYPWWYDNYWGWDHQGEHNEGESNPPVEQGTGHLWGSGGWASGGWGFSTKQPAPEPPSTTKPPKEEVKKPDDSKQQPAKPDNDNSKQEKKTDRNLWKPRKKGF
jgi:hypothetical protein